jgi:DNA-binding transcriptional LysR family regulator
MITIMLYEHIKKADLNLLQPLAVLLEEKHVSRAARRWFLSQSAMSRVLERLRDTEDIEAGRVDLLLDVAGAPSRLESESLFTDVFVCVVATDHSARMFFGVPP